MQAYRMQVCAGLRPSQLRKRPWSCSILGVVLILYYICYYRYRMQIFNILQKAQKF